MHQDDILETALRWHRAGRRVALATVTATWGSAPRPVGSLLAIADDAAMAGSVSGGCVEGAVVADALDAVRDGRSRVLEFGVSDDDAFAVGLACGGCIAIRVDPVAPRDATAAGGAASPDDYEGPDHGEGSDGGDGPGGAAPLDDHDGPNDPDGGGGQTGADATGAWHSGAGDPAGVIERDRHDAGRGRAATGTRGGGSDASLAGPGVERKVHDPARPDAGVLSVDLLERLVAARAGRHAVAHVIDTAAGTHRLADPQEFPDRFRADRSGFAEDGTTFVAVHNPPLRLIVVGAVHIAQPLLAMARLAGYDVTLVDPRPAFAAAERFPGEAIVEDWPDEALSALAPDARTAVVTLTHDPKLDDPAIRAALGSPAFYLGCLGSTRTHAKRMQRLAGLPGLDRIHAPVGLDIGARSPAEIALSVLAEVTQALRRG